jgi:dephospho-CoA kinase
MLIIGLTGGIGSGKSTVTQLFADFSIPIIDADVIAHQITQPNQPALKLIAENISNEILNSDGSLNRDKLRALIFSQPHQKQQLENLLHPLVYAEIAAQIAELNTAYCIVSVPLLIETQKNQMVDRILVIDCPEQQQIQRVMQRSQLTEVQVHAIMATQASRAQRQAVADDIIDNSNSFIHLAEQVKKLHNSYLLLSLA